MHLFGAAALPVVQHDFSDAAFKALRLHQTEEPIFYHFAISRPYCLLTLVFTTLADAVRYFMAGARLALSERKVTFEAQERLTKSRQYLTLMVATLAMGMLFPDYLIKLRSRYNLDGVARNERLPEGIKIPPQVVTISKVALGCLVSVAIVYVIYRLLPSDQSNPFLVHQFHQLKQEYSRTLSWTCKERENARLWDRFVRWFDSNPSFFMEKAEFSWSKLVEFVKRHPEFDVELPYDPSQLLSVGWCGLLDGRVCYKNEVCSEPIGGQIKRGTETDPNKIKNQWEYFLDHYHTMRGRAQPEDYCDAWHNEGYPVADWNKLLEFVKQYPSYWPQLPYRGFVDKSGLGQLTRCVYSPSWIVEKGAERDILRTVAGAGGLFYVGLYFLRTFKNL